MSNAGMLSVALAMPRTVRTNDWFRRRHPDVVADAERRTLARLWPGRAETTDASAAFDAEMAAYLSDPFRGSVERRVIRAPETPTSLQVAAARDAIAAAGLTPRDIDLALVATFYPERLDTGNSAFVAKELGLKGAAFNIETACASSVVGLQTAAAMIRAGEYEKVLVTVCCRYSHVIDDADTLSWFLADGAAAFVIGRCESGFGVLSAKTTHTADTCGVFFAELDVDPAGAPRVRMRADPSAGRVLRDTSAVHLIECCNGAVEKVGKTLADVDFFIFNTPVAWFAAFAARALGVDPKKTISVYPIFGNIGPVLMPANLHRAARERKLQRGDLVLLYAVGSVSSASAVLMRWGDVALGPDVPPGVEDE